MHGVAVALLAEDRDRLAILQQRVEATGSGRVVFSHNGFPSSTTDSILRQIQDLRAEIVLVDVDATRATRAVQTIELLKASTNDVSIFALGAMDHAPTIVSVMRAGACEFLDRSGDAAALQEAFVHFASQKVRSINSAGRARVLTFVNAKGGCGATTLAVNTALALQQDHGPTVLVDFGQLGHAALHLNVRPVFGLADALANLHRMDTALLKGFITPCRHELHLLAGLSQVTMLAPTTSELARLFDVLVTQYKHVVVDCSSRSDEITRMLCDLSHQVLMVAQTDVVTLWSAARMQSWFDQSGAREKIGLVINRYKKIAGFTDEDVKRATQCNVYWRVPNSYYPVASGIDRGEPILLQDNDLSRSIRALATRLVGDAGDSQSGLATTEKASSRRKAAARLLISPMRAGE